MKQLVLIILYNLISNLTFGQQKIYSLVSKSEKATINYKAFKNFDTLKSYKEEVHKKAFHPKKGKSDVYVFISEFEGDSFDGTRKKFHDYLILKVDIKTGKITDGFQYTMEWTDTPTADLYRVTEKSISLTDELNLDLLKMQLVKQLDASDSRNKLDDNGILKI